MTLIYGEYDQSIKFTELLSLLVNDTVKLEIVKGEDYHFSKNENDFITIPDKYLFYDVDK